MSESKPKNLYQKLAIISNEIGCIKKTGKNVQQNYNYIEYANIAAEIRSKFARYGVVIVPGVKGYAVDNVTTARGGTGFHYTLDMSFTVINTDDPNERIESPWLGEATDYGDKAVNKAETSGEKYFIMKLLNISEKGENEADATTPEPAQTVQPTRAMTTEAATTQQRATLHSLLGANYDTVIERAGGIEKLTKAKASKIIGQVMAKKEQPDDVME
jgi:hypothetical protein